jgi:hypothetical protein
MGIQAILCLPETSYTLPGAAENISLLFEIFQRDSSINTYFFTPLMGKILKYHPLNDTYEIKQQYYV